MGIFPSLIIGLSVAHLKRDKGTKNRQEEQPRLLGFSEQSCFRYLLQLLGVTIDKNGNSTILLQIDKLFLK